MLKQIMHGNAAYHLPIIQFYPGSQADSLKMSLLTYHRILTVDNPNTVPWLIIQQGKPVHISHISTFPSGFKLFSDFLLIPVQPSCSYCPMQNCAAEVFHRAS